MNLAFKLSLKLKNLFINSSMIKINKGKDWIGANHYDRFRNATKVNVIVTMGTANSISKLLIY